MIYYKFNNLLSDRQREVAIKTFIDREKLGLKNSINERKSRFKKNLHGYVNDKYSLKSIVNQINLIKKLETDKDYCVKMIIGNVSEFTETGVYVTNEMRILHNKK